MQGLTPIHEYGFIGYNDRLKPEFLKRGYAADALNVFFDRGFIDKRTGYTMIANDLGSKRCLGLGGFLNASGTKHILAAFDKADGSKAQLYYWTGSGNWTAISGSDIFTADTNVEFEMAAGKIYAYNGTDSVQSWDGSTRATVTAAPVVKSMRWFHNRMFGFNNTNYPSRLYFSNLGDPETWGASDYIDVNPNDGDYGVSLQILGNELLLGKRNRIWSFTGWGESTWDIKTINERVTGYGFIANRGCINVGNDLIYLSLNGDVPCFRSLRRTQYATIISGGIISDDIEGTMRGLSLDQLHQSAAAFDGVAVWFFVPNGSSTYNDLALRYNTLTKGWTRHTGINASCALLYAMSTKPELYFGEARADSKVYKMDDSYSDNGSAIDMRFISRRYQGLVSRKSKYKYLYIIGEEGTNTDLEVSVSPDGALYQSLGSFNLQATGSGLPTTFPFILGGTDVKRKRYSPGMTSYGMQVKLTNNTTDGPIGVREYSLHIKPKGLRDV